MYNYYGNVYYVMAMYIMVHVGNICEEKKTHTITKSFYISLN